MSIYLQGNAIFPVPRDAPKLSSSNTYKYFSKLFKGEANNSYPYRDVNGGILGYILRWNISPKENSKAKKEIRPFVYCEFLQGKSKWCSQGFPTPRPLFNLDKLATHSEDTILICEGEKTALAAENLFPMFVITTTMQGAQSAKLTDYSILKNRNVIIAMDQDDAGLK